MFSIIRIMTAIINTQPATIPHFPSTPTINNHDNAAEAKKTMILSWLVMINPN